MRLRRTEGATPGAWQCRERITGLEALRVSWTRRLVPSEARKPLVIEGYGLTGEAPLSRG